MPDGWLNFAMKAFLGGMERRQAKYRTKRDMDFKKSQGAIVGSGPYGYTRNGNGLREDPREQVVIKLVNDLYQESPRLVDIVKTAQGTKHAGREMGRDFTSQQVKATDPRLPELLRQDKRHARPAHQEVHRGRGIRAYPAMNPTNTGGIPEGRFFRTGMYRLLYRSRITQGAVCYSPGARFVLAELYPLTQSFSALYLHTRFELVSMATTVRNTLPLCRCPILLEQHPCPGRLWFS